MPLHALAAARVTRHVRGRRLAQMDPIQSSAHASSPTGGAGVAEFARLKDADPALSQVPVCVMTAFAASRSIPERTAVVLRKPLGSLDLFAVVKRFCTPPAG